MKQILSLVLAASFATSGFANYASLPPQYPVVKDCYADKYQLSLVPAEQKRVALQLLATNVPTAEQKVSSGKSVRLFGPEGVISGLNKTQTALGHAALVGMLANSTKQQAQARQNSVRLLAQNSQLADELATHLKRFAEAEAVFLKFYKESIDPKTEAYKPDPSPTWLGLKKRLSLLGAFANICGVAFPLPGELIVGGGLTSAAAWLLAKISRIQAPWNFISNWGSKVIMPLQLRNSYNQMQNEMNTAKLAGEITQAERDFRSKSIMFSSIWFLAACYGLWRYTANLNDMSAQQVPLRALKAALIEIDEISRILEQEHRLSQSLPELAPIKLLVDPNQNDDVFKRLLLNLQDDTFKEPFSHGSSFGTIETAQVLMNTSARMQLRNAFEAIGRLDAYLAAASLVTEGANGVKYSFVKWSNRGEPYLRLVDFCNPENPTRKATYEFRARTKTVLPRESDQAAALASAALFAQAFGIAPAREAELSPFEGLSVINNEDTNARGVVASTPTPANHPMNDGALVIIDHTATQDAEARKSCMQAIFDAAHGKNITIITTDCPHVAAASR